MSRRIGAALVSTLLMMTLGAVSITMAEDEEKALGWFDTAELGLVVTGGNSDTSTLGLKNTLERVWEKARFTLLAGAVRAESAFNRRAVGTSQNDYSVTDDTETTVDQYFLNGRYDRDITERFFWFAGAGWDRNEPAGIKTRYTGFGGVGNIWRDGEKVKFRTDYGLSYTDQTDVVSDDSTSDSFLGARFSWVYSHKFTESTTYGNDFIVDENLDETSDFRADMTNWVAVSMTKRMALKVSLRLLYDNDPSLEVLRLHDDADPDTPPSGVTVDNPLDELDSILTASLVINF